MTKCIFMTATGTDIGKTYVSALIVKKMRQNGFNCGYYKPVLSGYTEGENDCKYVIDKSGLDKKPTDCISYCFEEAVSPHLAAQRQGVKIQKEKILKDFEKIKKEYDYLLIEGAGGITCPLDLDNGYLLDNLIKDMNTDIIITADGGLGTINSVLLTCEYAKSKGINIQGIILNNYQDNFMYEDNKKSIEKLTGINVITTVKKDDNDIDIKESVFK